MTTEEMNIAAPAPADAPAPAPNKPPKKKRKLNKAVKRIITLVIVLAVLGGIAFGIWYFVFREEEEIGDIVTADVVRSTIESTASGYGNARAGANSAITLTADSTIREVFVNVGDQVFEGQPLYTAFSPDAEAQVEAAKKKISDWEKNDIPNAEKSLEAARKALSDRQQEYSELQGRVSELNIRAPFSGKLQDVADIAVGQDLPAGTVLATLVNDKQMKLTLYFSYAYENDISVGQAVDVSVPALMLMLQGKVEEIHKVDFISPEGGTYFEVDIILDNPGTLTAEMDASAIIHTASGAELYPYENGKLKFSGSVSIAAAQTGKVASISSLRNYTNVNEGDVLLTQSDEEFNKLLSDAADAVADAQEAIPAAEEAIVEAQNQLDTLQEELAAAEAGVTNLNAVSPINGSVTSCTIFDGAEVQKGTTVITISDTSNMTVNITVDDRNIGFVTPGMEVDLTDWNGNVFVGVVTNIDIENATMGSSMTTYPVTLTVENSSGALTQGVYLDYSFVTSQSADCLTVPIQCVKSIVDTEGNPHDVVFLKADSRPENAVDFEPPEEDEYSYNQVKYPTPEEGYWPVPVETGLSDRYNVEITSGLTDGDVVFNTYMMTGAWS